MFFFKPRSKLINNIWHVGKGHISGFNRGWGENKNDRTLVHTMILPSDWQYLTSHRKLEISVYVVVNHCVLKLQEKKNWQLLILRNFVCICVSNFQPVISKHEEIIISKQGKIRPRFTVFQMAGSFFGLLVLLHLTHALSSRNPNSYSITHTSITSFWPKQ